MVSSTTSRPAATTIVVQHRGLELVCSRWSPTVPHRAGEVVLLHGGGQTRHSWRALGPLLARAGWDVIAPDARGHGDSTWSAEHDYGMDAFVDDLMAVVRSACNGRPAVVGASLGGNTALLAAGEHPGVVNGVGLVDIVPRADPEGVARVRNFMTARPDGYGNLADAAEAVREYVGDGARVASPSGLRRAMREDRYGRWHWHWDPAFLKGYPPDRGASIERYEAAARLVEVPTLLVRGERSDVVSSEAARTFASLLQDAEVSVVAGAGHMVATVGNETFAEVVADFLQRRCARRGVT